MSPELRPNYANWSPGLLSVLRGAVDHYPISLTLDGRRYIATDPRGGVVIVNSGTLAAEAITIQLARDRYIARQTPTLAVDYRVFLIHTPDMNSCMLVEGRAPHLRLWRHENVADLLKLLVFQLPISPHERTRLHEGLAGTVPVAAGRSVMREVDRVTEEWLLVRLPVPLDRLPKVSERVTLVPRYKVYSELEAETPSGQLLNRFADENASLLAAARRGIR